MCDASQLIALPIVPYALSLSFCVAYKQIKRCHLPSTQDAAKQHMRALYKSLETLSPTWWSAQVMTRLGRRALGEIQRTDRANDQALPGMPHGNRLFNLTSPAEYASTPGPSDLTASENMRSPNGTTSRQQPSDFADLGGDAFGYLSGNDDLDIDNILGNFLNINVPTCPTHSSFTDFEMAWDDQIPDCASFYR